MCRFTTINSNQCTSKLSTSHMMNCFNNIITSQNKCHQAKVPCRRRMTSRPLRLEVVWSRTEWIWNWSRRVLSSRDVTKNKSSFRNVNYSNRKWRWRFRLKSMRKTEKKSLKNRGLLMKNSGWNRGLELIWTYKVASRANQPPPLSIRIIKQWMWWATGEKFRIHRPGHTQLLRSQSNLWSNNKLPSNKILNTNNRWVTLRSLTCKRWSRILCGSRRTFANN